MTITAVAEQYEQYPYPAAPLNLESEQPNYSDPSQFAVVFWPNGRPASPLNILVAGCGTSQAALIALRNPRARVLGIDLSGSSIAHEEKLRTKYNLENVELRQGDFLTTPIEGNFDLIASTGVLHHLPDPEAGLRRLVSLLNENGALSLMLYATGARVGVYMLQDAFRRMGLARDRAGIEVVRSVLKSLPKTHPGRYYADGSTELVHDEAIVDAFLHAQDRSYTVPQVLSFLRSGGLELQAWMDPATYNPDVHFAPLSAVGMMIRRLPIEEQWAVVEQLTARSGRHIFAARRKAVSFSFDDDNVWPGFYPVRNPLCHVDGEQISNGTVRSRMNDRGSRLFSNSSGGSTIAQIAASAGEQLTFAKAFFSEATRVGNVFLSLVPVTAH